MLFVKYNFSFAAPKPQNRFYWLPTRPPLSSITALFLFWSDSDGGTATSSLKKISSERASPHGGTGGGLFRSCFRFLLCFAASLRLFFGGWRLSPRCDDRRPPCQAPQRATSPPKNRTVGNFARTVQKISFAYIAVRPSGSCAIAPQLFFCSFRAILDDDKERRRPAELGGARRY